MTAQHHQPQKEDNALAMSSMIMGIVSMLGPGLLLGIPAIITGAIALKQKKGDRAYSLTGLITGIASTVLSILAIIFFIVIVALAASSPDTQLPHESSPVFNPYT